MKCWHCNTELIWGGDHDIEEENEEYSMVTIYLVQSVIALLRYIIQVKKH